jgi:serine protease Do
MRHSSPHLKARTRRLIIGLVLAFLAADGTPPLWSAADTPSPNLNFARQLNQAFVEVAEKASAAVVVIEVIQPDQDEGTELSPAPAPRDFHHRSPAPQDPRSDNSGPRRMVESRASGVIVTPDGFILTNNHVVQGAERIRVRFRDGHLVKARLQGADPESDLAVIKIDATGLTAAKLADSAAAKVGEFVLAIGAPFELDYSVTIGHISAKGRSFEGTMGIGYLDQDFIQTDASINPGNSGGPLVNLDGEVVGINAMIRGMRTGIGFAIPSDLARRVMTRLIRDGKFVRSWLGVGITSLRDNPDYQDLVHGPADGVVIREIIPGGPASKSELRPGDIVVAVDGNPVKTSRQLKDEVAYKESGQSIALDVVRDAKPVRLTVKSEALPAPTTPKTDDVGKHESEQRDLGLTVKNLTRELANEFKIEQKTGVVVTDVELDSPADAGQIQPGDVVTAVDRKPVANLPEFRKAMKQADPKKGIILHLLAKDGASRFTILKENGD